MSFSIAIGMFGAAARGPLTTTAIARPRNPVAGMGGALRLTAATLIMLATAMARPAAAAADDRWRFDIAPYAWATSLSGNATAGGTTTSVDSDFSDIVNDSDSLIGMMLYAEAGKGRWSGFVDITYGQVGVDNIPTSSGSLDVTTKTLFVEAAGTYRFIADQPLGALDNRTTWSLDGVLGARVTSLGLELDLEGVGNVDEDKTWAEPYFGARARFLLSERWVVQLYGDIGGFGLGSDFAWQAEGLVGYRFHIGHTPTTAFVGYRALSQDYSDDGFEWDATVHGPVIGMNFSF